MEHREEHAARCTRRFPRSSRSRSRVSCGSMPRQKFFEPRTTCPRRTRPERATAPVHWPLVLPYARDFTLLWLGLSRRARGIWRPLCATKCRASQVSAVKKDIIPCVFPRASKSREALLSHAGMNRASLLYRAGISVEINRADVMSLLLSCISRRYTSLFLEFPILLTLKTQCFRNCYGIGAKIVFTYN